MATKNQILDMTALGMKFTVLKTSLDTEGKSLELKWELSPGCNMIDPLFHLHPEAIETYEILDGEMEFFVKDKWIIAKKGDKLTVQKGITHAFRNPTKNIVTVYNTHEPALRMEYYFEDVCKILTKLTDNKKKHFKMNFKSMLYMGNLMQKYRREIIAKKPPDFAIKVLGLASNFLNIKY